MKHPTTNLYLLHNRILMMLYAAGPRTNEEIAALLNNKPASVRGANSLNIAMGLAELVQPNRTTEAVFTITQDGIDRIKALPATQPGQKVPPTRGNPVKAKVLVQMKLEKGLKATDWAKVTTSRNRLYAIVDELKRLGYVIAKRKTGNEVTYHFVSAPKLIRKPSCSSVSSSPPTPSNPASSSQPSGKSSATASPVMPTATKT